LNFYSKIKVTIFVNGLYLTFKCKSYIPVLISLQIWGCEKSGLFHAFSKHILHRLKIPLHERSDTKIRVTLLSRDTAYRRILNEKELIEGLHKNPNYIVKKVRMPLLNSVCKFVLIIMY